MAKGLHVSLSCQLPDKPQIIDAGDIAELVYYRAVMRCREYLTDGVIDRRIISRWFAGIRGKPATHLDRLVAVGLLEPHDQGWCIPLAVWTAWNPTAEQVAEKRQQEADRKAEYREKKRRESQQESADVPS